MISREVSLGSARRSLIPPEPNVGSTLQVVPQDEHRETFIPPPRVSSQHQQDQYQPSNPASSLQASETTLGPQYLSSSHRLSFPGTDFSTNMYWHHLVKKTGRMYPIQKDWRLDNALVCRK